MYIHKNQHPLSRRAFLRGWAGTALALPLLEAMCPFRLSAVGPQPSLKPPPRCVFIYTPNGVNCGSWFPRDSGPTFTFSPTLQPLAPLRDDVTVISGLHHPNAQNGHEVDSNWLTGVNIHGTPGYDVRNDISMDQLVAEEVGKATRYPSFVMSSDYSGTISWGRGSISVPARNNPKAIFEQLFTSNGEDPAALRRQIGRDINLLDTVLEDANNLNRKLGRNDKEKLDEYLTAVRDVEARLGRAVAWTDVPKPKEDGGFIHANSWGEDVGGYLRAMYDCMALAIQTDSTRVVTYTIWGETTAFVIPETGVKEGHHNLTHNNNDPLKLANLAKLDTYLVQQFAYFLDKLKNATEGEGSLLDTTMCMYGSGASMTHIHYHLPILFAGGSKLGLRHGQHLDLSLAARAEAGKSMEAAVQEAGLFDGHKINRDARLCNLLLTIGQKMGLPIDSFRDSTGPIKELLA